MDTLLTYNSDFVSWLNLVEDDSDYLKKYKKMHEWRTYNSSGGRLAGNKPK